MHVQSFNQDLFNEFHRGQVPEPGFKLQADHDIHIMGKQYFHLFAETHQARRGVGSPKNSLGSGSKTITTEGTPSWWARSRT